MMHSVNQGPPQLMRCEGVGTDSPRELGGADPLKETEESLRGIVEPLGATDPLRDMGTTDPPRDVGATIPPRDTGVTDPLRDTGTMEPSRDICTTELA